MTGKCCRDCVHFTGRYCNAAVLGNSNQFRVSGGSMSEIEILQPDTFYCAAFTRRNSAKPIGGEEVTEDNTKDSTIPTHPKEVCVSKPSSTFSNPKAPLFQLASEHRCIACGEQHPGCCEQCIQFVPEKVPCLTKCGHWVCNEGLAEYLGSTQ